MYSTVKKCLSWVLCLGLALTASACGGVKNGVDGGFVAPGGGMGGIGGGGITGDMALGGASEGAMAEGGEIAGDAYVDGDYTGGVDGGADKRPNGGQFIQSGQLTAGEWNDNKHYRFYQDLFAIGMWCEPDEQGNIGEPENGIFAEYLHENAWGMHTQSRIEVSVKGVDGKPAANAEIVLASQSYDENGNARMSDVYARARTDANGVGYLFPNYVLPDVEMYVMGGYGEKICVGRRNDEGVYEITLEEESRSYSSLDLCFMIDTTGSMGDELHYLQAEIGDVISRVQTELTGVDIRLGLIFYRDQGDAYVVREFDFSSDIAAQQKNLRAQNYAGGGDYPEAVHDALSAALGLSWRTEARKVLIPVLDAPPHAKNGQGDIRNEFGKLVYSAAEKGIATTTVASSGVDTLTQYLFRSTALLTGGTYIFLTDDSGIGYGHDKPSVGEFTVEYLNACLFRVIAEMYDGVAREAVPYRNQTSE